MKESAPLRKISSEGSICTIRMLISFDDRDFGKLDIESALVDTISSSMSRQIPITRRSHPTTKGFSLAPHVLRYRKTSAYSGTEVLRHKNDNTNLHKMEGFSGSVAMTTQYNGLLLSLPCVPKQKTIQFVVGKQEDEGSAGHNHQITRWIRRHSLFHRHSACYSAKGPLINETEKDGAYSFRLRRSLSVDTMQKKRLDVTLLAPGNSHFDICSWIPPELQRRKTLGNRIKRVARGLNLVDMHWPPRKHSNISTKSGGSAEATTTTTSLKIQTCVSRT